MWAELTITIILCVILVILVTLGWKMFTDYLLKRRYVPDGKNAKFKSREQIKRDEEARRAEIAGTTNDRPTNVGVEQPGIQQLPEVVSGTTETGGNEDPKPELSEVIPRTIKTLKKLKKS